MEDCARRLVALAGSLATERSLDRLLARVLEAVVAVSGAERGFVVILEDGEAGIRRAYPPEARREVSWTILGRVLAENRPLLLADALEDPDFGGAGSVRRGRVRSVCAIPLRSPREAIGAVYLDHRAMTGVFETTMLDMLHAFAGLAAAAIGNVRRSAPVPEPERDLPAPASIVAIDPEMRRVVRAARRYAKLPYPVYLHGESGTGKEVIARLVHDGREGPFVAANCAAIAGSLAESELFGHVRGAFTGADRDHAGLFEQAHRGTLFLDEVEAMPAALQEKLLRVLQDGEVRRVGGRTSTRVDARIVSASNADLEALEGRFRRDLFYRLNVLRLDLPPLRARPGDLPALTEHFLARIVRETGGGLRRVGAAAMERLRKHTWPGNVRELENALRRACATGEGEVLSPRDFEFLDRATRTVAGTPVDPVPVDAHLRKQIELFGERMSNSELADRLGISRKTLWKKKKLWGL